MSGFGRSETMLGAVLGTHDVLDTTYVATKRFPLLPIASLEGVACAAVICRAQGRRGRFGIAEAARLW